MKSETQVFQCIADQERNGQYDDLEKRWRARFTYWDWLLLTVWTWVTHRLGANYFFHLSNEHYKHISHNGIHEIIKSHWLFHKSSVLCKEWYTHLWLAITLQCSWPRQCAGHWIFAMNVHNLGDVYIPKFNEICYANLYILRLSLNSYNAITF